MNKSLEAHRPEDAGSSEQASVTDLRAVLVAVVKAATWVALPFVVLIGYLLLHRAGVVPRVKEVAYERTLILNLALYWLVAALALAAWLHRREVLRFLGSIKAQIALLAFSTLLSFAFAEVALRILRPQAVAQPFERLSSETLHHKNAPNRRSLGMGRQWVETNSDGFRSPYEPEAFHQLTHRVVLLGDSFTFGLGVAEEESVGAVLETELKKHLQENGSDASVGVLNTGVISYSPLLVRQAFRQVIRDYRPTVALMLVDANDIGDDHQYARENISGDPDNPRFDVPPMQESSPGLCDRSAICRTLGPLWDRLGKPKQVLLNLLGRHRDAYDYYAFEVEVDGVKERNRFFILRHPLAKTLPFFDHSWSYIEDVAEDVYAEGADFVLVVMPRYFHWDDSECPENWEKDRYGVDEPFENAFLEFFDQKIASRQDGFPIWSLLEPFQVAGGGPETSLVFDHDPHWNASGHRVAGEALAAGLVGAGWPLEPSEKLTSLFSKPSFPTGALDSQSPLDSTGADESADADRPTGEAKSEESP